MKTKATINRIFALYEKFLGLKVSTGREYHEVFGTTSFCCEMDYFLISDSVTGEIFEKAFVIPYTDKKRKGNTIEKELDYLSNKAIETIKYGEGMLHYNFPSLRRRKGFNF